MKNRDFHARNSIILFFACLVMAGCAQGDIVVKGRVTKGGQPLEIADNEGLQVSFIPIRAEKEEFGDLFAAQTNSKKSTFIVHGVQRKGIPPGKYRIDVEIMPNRGEDRLEGKFSGPKSPIIREINSDEELHLDLDNPGP